MTNSDVCRRRYVIYPISTGTVHSSQRTLMYLFFHLRYIFMYYGEMLELTMRALVNQQQTPTTNSIGIIILKVDKHGYCIILYSVDCTWKRWWWW